jgi:hypothetical protein
MAFPRTQAHDLLGVEHTVPDDLPGKARLLVLAFQRSHQTTVDQWTVHARQMIAKCDGLTVWELPVMARLYAPARSYIDGGMLAGSGDGERARHTLTLYTDLGRFAQALSIPDFESVHVLLIDEAGDVVWRAAGAPGVTALESLDAAVERMCGPFAA